jgi:hypothetical protein
MGPVAKSYMRKGVLKYGEMHKYLTIYEEAFSHIYMTLQPLPYEFPYTRILGKFDFLFYQCNYKILPLCFSGCFKYLSFWHTLYPHCSFINQVADPTLSDWRCMST